MEGNKTRLDVYDDDWISQLPDFILHHILSFLVDSPKEYVRMSVLSKNWFAVTASFPILDFNMDSFIRDIDASGIPFDIVYVRDMFFKYVDYTTSRFCRQNNVTSVHSFNLIGVPQEPSQLYIVDRCVGLILQKGGLQVLKIDININTISPLRKYCLPNLLLSASSLSSLIIHDCELPSSLMADDVIKFKSLKLLHLERLTINEQVIKHLTNCCPLLEEFMLLICHGFKRFCINGFQNLQKVKLFFKDEVERIDIDAPNLCYFFLVDWDRGGGPCMNVSSCKKLTTLIYCGYPFPKLKGSTDFFSNFPFIEKLFLATSDQRCNLKLTSHSLRTLVLHSRCDLDVIEINTPNLLLFKYCHFCFLSEPLVRNSAKSEAQMEWYPTDDVNALWFKELRHFLNKRNGFKVLKLHICSSFIDVEEVKVIHSPPFELEHVDLELGSIKELSVYVAVVDVVLWCFRPRSLTLKSDFHFLDFEQRSHVVKFTYEKLLQQEDEGWTNIQIVLSISSSKAKKHFNDLNSLLAALPRDPRGHIITLIKEEDPNSCRSSRMHQIQEPVSAETSTSLTKIKETSMRKA